MTLRRLLPLAILAALIAAVFALGLDRYLTLDALRDNRSALLDIVKSNAVAPTVAPTTVKDAPSGTPNRNPPARVIIVAPGSDNATTAA